MVWRSVGAVRGERYSRPMSVTQVTLYQSQQADGKKGMTGGSFKFICHVFFNQPGKIMCRVSSKHARAGLFYIGNISERSFSIAIL